MDKTIEVMKAAMEKEKQMEELSKETSKENPNSDTNTADIQDENEAINTAETETSEDNTEEEEDMENNDMVNETDHIEEASDGKQSKKSLFKNRSKELSLKDQQIEELTDRLMRTMAEFDNYRKRTEKEKAQMFDIGAKTVIEKLLPIIDNFERGLGTISEAEKESAFAQGIELIYRQLMTTLTEMGVTPIDAVGKEFDPTFHNAVMHGEDETMGENIISEEFQKGYIYKDMVVRHSMVKVVN